MREAIYESHGIMTSADKDNVIICSEPAGSNKNEGACANRPLISSRKRNSGFTPSGCYGKKKPRHNSVGSAASEKLKESCTEAVVSFPTSNTAACCSVTANAKAQHQVIVSAPLSSRNVQQIYSQP